MKTIIHFLKVLAIAYCIGFAVHSTHRFLDQRDEMVKIEQVNTTLKAIELQGNVHCEPS